MSEGAKDEKKEVLEVPTCKTKGCETDATWKFPYSDHSDYFCIFHAYEIVIMHAAMNLNRYQPMFFQAHPIEVKSDGTPAPACLFVCQQGHIGRIFIIVNKEEEFEIISFYRECTNCDRIAEELIEQINKTMFGGKGKWQHRRRIDRRNIEVA